MFRFLEKIGILESSKSKTLLIFYYCFITGVLYEHFPRDPELLLVADLLVEDVVLLGDELLVDLPPQVGGGIGGLRGAVQLQQVPNLYQIQSVTPVLRIRVRLRGPDKDPDP